MIITDIDPLTLPSLPLNERSHLPYCPAVYFVVANNNVLYIGQTANLHDRWLAHHRWGQLKELNELVRIAWLECGEHHLLTEIEAALISHFEPPL
ncbi:MAG TPA: excinuclease ABC C subunit domain-containing protein, partial [Cyanobacteria bacterium UBA12227]|nr:excinuclease ABC C subunit domain-containing protein [Cyanobacteria bacterium UBA12227]